ncbi:porin [Labrys monachus]|uniref:Porin n=1 Tax=Labrys monachus TaxID=217067 RepID=A0ABU0FHS6_9HYPH|nr:porin [Labrys monachus]MDQ0394150.1 hypothetical protein [Labrys monachus]
MKMKSFLLGAAAGIAVVGVAQAADLPVTKAEAVEYVKVCTQYGPGFFYIPGTDSCLKISGNIRADYTFNSVPSRPVTVDTNGTVQSTGSKRSLSQTSFQGRAQIGFDVRTDTDYGLLRSYLLIDAATGNSGGQSWQVGSVHGSNIYVDKAYIQFGGLTAGYAESFYAFYDNYYGDTFFAPYFGSGGIGTKQLIAYTAQFGGGFSATLSVEDPAEARLGSDTRTLAGAKMPNFIGNILYDASWGRAQLMAALHESSTISDVAGDTGSQNKWGYAIGAGLSLDLPLVPGAYLAVEGNYAHGANAFTGTNEAQFSPAGAPEVYDSYETPDGREKQASSWSVTGEAGFDITPQLTAMVFGSYANFDAPTGTAADFTSYVAGAQLNYQIVKGLKIGAEVYYVNTRSDGDSGSTIVLGEGTDGTALEKSKTDAVVGGIRIERSF